MQHLTTQHLVDILNQLGPVFDAHAAEKKALGMYAQLVGQELARCNGTTNITSLQMFSMQFAQTIDQTFGSVSKSPQIQKTKSGKKGDGKVESENLAGKMSLNQEWKKLGDEIKMPE